MIRNDKILRTYKSHVKVMGSKMVVKNYPAGKYVWKRPEDEKQAQKYEFLTDWYFRHVEYTHELNDRIMGLYWSNIRQHKPKNDPKFLTFTFRENVQDIEYAWEQWDLFRRKFNRKMGVDLKYVSVLEFQNGERKKELKEKYNAKGLDFFSINHLGCIHFHVIFFNLAFIDNSDLSLIWGHGFTNIRSVKHLKSENNFAVYDMIKYMNTTDFDIRIKDKKIYSSSRGLIKPTIKTFHETIRQPSGKGFQTNCATYDSKMDGRVYKYDFYQSKHNQNVILSNNKINEDFIKNNIEI